MNAIATASLLPIFEHNIDFDKMLVEYRNYMDSRCLSKRTIEDNCSRLQILWDRYLSPLCHGDLRAVTLTHLTTAQGRLRRQIWCEKTISTNSVRHYMSSAKGFFRWLARFDHLPYDPCVELDLPKRQKRKSYEVPTKDDMIRLLSATSMVSHLAIRDRAILFLIYDCGLRSEEVRHLTMSNLRLSARVIDFCGKGSKQSVLPLSTATIHILTQYITAVRTDLILGKCKSGGREYKGIDALENEIVFPSKNGNVITAQNLLSIVAKYARKAGLDFIPRVHALRSAMCTHIYKEGCGVIETMRLMRHESLNTTLGYISNSKEELKSAHESFHPLSKKKGENDL